MYTTLRIPAAMIWRVQLWHGKAVV